MIALFLAIVAVIELARRMPLLPAFRDLQACSARSMRVVARRGVSEWGKERAMRLLSARMFVASLRAGALLVVTASPLLIVLAISAMAPQQLRLGDWQARLWLVPLTLGYGLLRWQVGQRVRAR